MEKRIAEMAIVDRVAMALAAKYHGTAKVAPQYVFGEATGGRIFVEMAVAAIAEMRIPSQAMLDAVSEEEERRGYAASAYESMDAEAAWPVMIDAALKENEEKA